MMGGRQAMKDAPIKGPIAEIFLPRLIARLHRDNFEGLLRITLHEATKIIYFRRGDISSAASNAEPDRLANVLIRDARLTQAQLDLARSRIQEGGSLGKALIEMGFLTPSELLEGARRQVREILASCFALSGGTYQIEPGSPPPEVTSLGLPTKRLIFDSLTQIADRPPIVREVGSMESVYRPLRSLDAGLAALRLGTETDRIARMPDGALTLREISGRTSLDDFGVSKVLLALEILGLIERVGSPVARQEEQTGRTIVIDPQSGQSDPETAGAAAPAPAAGLAGAEDDPVGAPAEAASVTPEIPAGAPPTGAPSEESEAEQPPPIPSEELPAFALPAGTAEWQTDPATGERVHLGPIEVTFEGAIPAARNERASLPRLLGMAAVVTAVLAGLVGYLITRQGGSAPDVGVVSRAPAVDAGPPVPAAPPPLEAGGDPPGTSDAAPATQPAQIVKEEAETGGTDRADEAPGPSRRSPPAALTQTERRPVPAPPTPAPPAKSVPSPGPAGPDTPFKDAARYREALRQLDGGDPRGSARAFLALIAVEDPARFTLQIMIACQDDTVTGARAQAGDGGAYFFVPYSLKGRDCFRVCWGLYPTGEAAREAIPTLPEVFLKSAGRPVVLPLASLRPAN
jgi:septal ring-binding cell division protein DamX